MASAVKAGGEAAAATLHTPIQSTHPACLWSARMSPTSLLQHFPLRKLPDNKQLVWDKMQARAMGKEGATPKGAPAPPMLRVSRYDSSRMPMGMSDLLRHDTHLSIVKSVYSYDVIPPERRKTHFYVNFADAQLFGFYASNLFAQDEWQCLEHPSLCALRDYMHVQSKSDPLCVPRTVSRQLPTPVIVMNAPREVEIDALGANLYGNAFSRAKSDVVDAATRVLSTGPGGAAPLSHIIAMEALKHRHGRYTERDISLIIQTAVCAFKAAMVESAQESKDAEGPQAGGAASVPPTVVIHTGNWGCGAFGGNVELMCLLQLVSARLACVRELHYHVLSDSNEHTCQQAVKKLDTLLQALREKDSAGQEVTMADLIARIESMGFEWGYSNGT